jgi:hypothetical protein
MVARLGSRSKKTWFIKTNRPPEYAPAACFSLEDYSLSLSSARDFRSFGIDTTSVESVINNLSHGRNVRVNIHSITRGKMPNDSFGGDFICRTGQLRKASCLDMIDSLKPLSQRQALV